MIEVKTNHEILRDELIANPELRAKYFLSREKVRIEMMLEALEENVKKENSKQAILKEIRNISNYISKIAVV